MAKNYTRPLAEVYQLLEVTQQATGDHLAACIVGPQYDLYRYGKEEDITGTPYNARGQLIDLEYAKDPTKEYSVAREDVQLYLEGAEACYCNNVNMGVNTSYWKMSGPTATTLTLAVTGNFISRDGGKTGTALVSGRVPQVGDIVRLSTDGVNPTTTYDTCDVRTVTGLEYAVTGNETSIYQPANFVDVVSSVAITKDPKEAVISTDTDYELKCVSAPATANIVGSIWTYTDTAGVDNAGSFVVGADKVAYIGSDKLKVTFKEASVSAGKTVGIHYKAPKISTTDIIGININAPGGVSNYWTGDGLPIYLSVLQSGELPTTTSKSGVEYTNWTALDLGDKVTISQSAGLTAAVEGAGYCPLLNGIGTIYPEFRVNVKSVESPEIVTINSVADIQENFGTIDIDNDLAYACYTALTGAAGREIYAVRTNGTDKAAFAEAVKVTEFDSSLYSFTPLTNDPEIMDVVVSFNAKMSQPDVKMWRRTILGIDSPGEYTVTSKDNAGHDLIVSVSGGIVTPSASMNIDFTNLGLFKSYTKLGAGDIVEINSKRYTVAGTPTADQLVLTDSSVNITSARATLKKAASVENTIEYVGAIAKYFNTRRALVVFCDGGTIATDDATLVVSNKYIASEIAGLSSAVVPQQSITHTEVSSISRATRMYSLYTNDDMDDLAVQGVLVVTQDYKSLPCYIRHQLTTEMDKGNLYYEDSCTRNLDNISYKVADIVNTFVGRANVTVPALRKLKVQLTAALTDFTNDTTDELIGPSLVDWSDLEVYQDPTFKDRVIVKVKLYLPLPMNNIKVYEMAYIAKVTI